MKNALIIKNLLAAIGGNEAIADLQSGDFVLVALEITTKGSLAGLLKIKADNSINCPLLLLLNINYFR